MLVLFHKQNIGNKQTSVADVTKITSLFKAVIFTQMRNDFVQLEPKLDSKLTPDRHPPNTNFSNGSRPKGLNMKEIN